MNRMVSRRRVFVAVPGCLVVAAAQPAAPSAPFSRRPREGGGPEGHDGRGRLAAGASVRPRAVRLDAGRVLHGRDGADDGDARRRSTSAPCATWATATSGGPGLRPGHADDYAVVATYVALYQIDKDPKYLAAGAGPLRLPGGLSVHRVAAVGQPHRDARTGVVRRAVHGAAAAGRRCRPPPATGSTSTSPTACGGRSPTTCTTRPSTSTSATAATSIRSAPNGRKVFWSRGNGWVFAGLARILQDMPADYPDRPRYVTLFRDMAATVS